MAGVTGEKPPSGRARKGRSRRAESAAQVMLRLAEKLPALDHVREVDAHDCSDLTPAEQGQLQRTEEVITGAIAAGDGALWVIAQAVECAAKGRWWRNTHDSLTAYVEDTTGRSAVYVRQLRMNAPLALEMARRIGTVPKPSQMKAVRKTEQHHGLDAAVTLYEVVRDVADELEGETTARSLTAVHGSLPKRLPEQGDARRVVIEQVARRVLCPRPIDSDRGSPRPGPRLAGHWQIQPSEFEQEANGGASIEAAALIEAPPFASSAPLAPDAAGDDESLPQAAVQGTATPPVHPLRTLEEALAALAAIDERLTNDVYTQAISDPIHAQDCERIRQHIIIRAAAIRGRALRGPRR